MNHGDWRVRIVPDDEYNADPGANVSWDDPAAEREYVARFERGELTAYGVIIEHACRDHDGPGYQVDTWHQADSLWGVDSEYMGAEGTYTHPARITDTYLRTVTAGMWPWPVDGVA